MESINARDFEHIHERRKRRLIITPVNAEALEIQLKKSRFSYKKNSLTYTIEFLSVTDSIDFLCAVKENVSFYEVIKGSMGDVFLNIVGEKLYSNGGIS